MESRHFAVIASVVVYLFSYVIIFYCLGVRYTVVFNNIKFLKKYNDAIFIYIFTSTIFITPLLVGCIFYVGGFMEKGNGISWGCYIEDFIIVSFLIWLFLLFIFTIFIIVCLVMPNKLCSTSRFKLFQIFVLQNLISIFILFMCYVFIPIIANSLTGLKISCW